MASASPRWRSAHVTVPKACTAPTFQANGAKCEERLFPLNGEQPQEIRPGRECGLGTMNERKAWERGCRGRILPGICLSAGRLHSSNLGRRTGYEEIVGSIVVQAERFRDFATN